MNTYKN